MATLKQTLALYAKVAIGIGVMSYGFLYYRYFAIS